MESRQLGIRNCFEVGQSVLVREGTRWVTRTIEKITVYRGCDAASITCPRCGMPILGEPRFWFKGWSNIPISEVMAKEDIDPEPDVPVMLRSPHVVPIFERRNMEGPIEELASIVALRLWAKRDELPQAVSKLLEEARIRGLVPSILRFEVVEGEGEADFELILCAG